MKTVVRDSFEKEGAMLRETYCNTLMDLAKSDERIIALDADLMSSSGMKPFMKAFPERFINCGVAEANMVGVAAGLSATGKIPFAHTFGTFATRRVCDQIFMSCAYAGLNVRIVGTDPGVCAAFNGGTHMPFEDMAVLRAIPQITLVEPTDSVMLKNLLPKLAAAHGTFYIRMLRKNAVAIYAEGSEFELGRAAQLREGSDVTLICSGILVHEALKAADLIAEQGKSARVLNMFTWKPLDERAVLEASDRTGAIVTCENHNVTGGLGSAVAESLVKGKPCPVEMIGVQDIFGEVGPEDYLRARFNLTAVDIAAAAMRAIKRK